MAKYNKIKYVEVYDTWGQLLCRRCEKFRDLSLYYSHRAKRGRVCKICHRARDRLPENRAKSRARYANDPVLRVRQIARSKAWNLAHRSELQIKRKALRIAGYYVLNQVYQRQEPATG